MYKHILLPTDGSDLSLHGVRHGLALAKESRCKATVITVSAPFTLRFPGTAETWVEAQNRTAEATFAAAQKLAEEVGVEIVSLHRAGESPAEIIVDAAKELGCDLIVMASHGRRGVTRMLLGSQTAEVVRLSEVPVLVVR